MIAKENLLNMLEKSLQNEDNFIINYGTGFLKEISASGFLSDDEKKAIGDMLAVLLQDTQRHKQAVEALINRIQGDARNEF